MTADSILPSGRRARIARDPFDPNALELFIDGTEQSHVYPDDPTRLRYDYLRRMHAAFVCAVGSRPAPRVLHLGGGALTLPRCIAAERPAAEQTIVDAEAGLIGFVLTAIPSSALGGCEFVTTDADAAVRMFGERRRRFDVVLHDVYVGVRLPEHLTEREHVEHLAEVLAPGGVVVINVADDAGTPLLRRIARVLRDVFPSVIVDGPTSVLDGSRDGNAVLIASRQRTEDWIPALLREGPHPVACGPVDEILRPGDDPARIGG